jgi:hypothetical protein
MRSSKSIRIDAETYRLLQTEKENIQEKEGKKITYSQLIRDLLNRKALNPEFQETASLPQQIQVKIPQFDEEFPIKCEMQIPLSLPEAGILLKEEIETKVKKYAEEHNISLSEAVNILLLYALELRKEVFVVLTSNLKNEFESLYAVLDEKEKEKLKKDLKKIVTLYTRKLLKSYSKKVKSRKRVQVVKR